MRKRQKNDVTPSDVSTQELISNPIARVLARFYPLFPSKRFAAALISRLEGGQMLSSTLRRLLRQHHGVEVGAHSYGGLLVPGAADRMTSIGRYASIGPNVMRLGAAHPVEDLSMHPYWYLARFGYVGDDADVPRTGVEIGDDCWIGANTTILPGCRRIGIGAVIGAGSIVTHDVADFAIVMGVPARQVRTRLSEPLRSALLKVRPWLLPPEGYREAMRRIVD